jgi:invasion protein IalB
MIRSCFVSFLRRSGLSLGALALAAALAAAPAAQAQTRQDPKKQAQASKATPKKPAAKKATSKKPDPKKAASAKPDTRKPDPKKPAAAAAGAGAAAAAGAGAAAAAAGGKPAPLQTYGDWAAYAIKGEKARACYAVSAPKDRQPASLKRDPGYLFVTHRPTEGVRNELSFTVGFDVKTNAPAKAEIGAASFDLVAKGGNLWIKNAAEEAKALDAMRKGSRLVVKAQSLRGNTSTDVYSLSGLAQALDRVQKECQ